MLSQPHQHTWNKYDSILRFDASFDFPTFLGTCLVFSLDIFEPTCNCRKESLGGTEKDARIDEQEIGWMG